MHLELVRKLVEIGVIRQNTEIEAFYSGVDMAGCPFARTLGTFTISNVRLLEGKAEFEGRSTRTGERKWLLSEDVERVDGMETNRLASIYGFDLAGGKIKQGRRRGRKPKVRTINEN